MKTKEFIVKVEALGFLVHNGHCYLEVKDTEGKDVVDVLKRKRWVYDCEFDAFESLHEVKQTELMEFVTEYVTTQVKDREEEKRSYLRNVSPLLRGSGRGYLAKNKDTLEYYALSLKCSEEFYQTIFTESEIAEMDTTGFEKIRVME